MKTFSMTDAGQIRDINQDDMYTSEMPVGNLPNLFLVADGMGGHAAGDYASRCAIEETVDFITHSELTEPVALMREAIGRANRFLLQAARREPEKAGMGTTLVAASCVGHQLYTANVGDSRLYLINQETITQITRDHSLVGEMVRSGRIAESEAKIHPDKNVITRAVGVFEEVAVDFFETQIEEGDMILMCSDGLTNEVSDADIKRIVLGQRDIVERAEKLIEAANKNGGHDNITVVLIEPFVE